MSGLINKLLTPAQQVFIINEAISSTEGVYLLTVTGSPQFFMLAYLLTHMIEWSASQTVCQTVPKCWEMS